MITVGMNYQVIDGMQKDFEDKFNAVIQALEAADGHNESSLYKDVNNQQSYLIVSDWASEEAFASFIKSDEFRSVTDWGKEQILSDRPRHKVYKS